MKETKLPKKELIHEFNTSKKRKISASKETIFVVVIMLLLGTGTGYIASNVSGATDKTPLSVDNEGASLGEIKKGFTAGVKDTAAFPDTTEGIVREGGIDGEGEYHLERPGGESQNVYMTSSTVDLSNFIGKKIKVWGSTQKAQKAGWLMDVGKIEVL